MTSAEFVAAQQRAAARRQQRDELAQAHAQVHLARLQQLDRPGILDRLPAPINNVLLSLSSTWTAIQGREGIKPSFRVGQVDAELLDEELLELFKGQVGEALKYYGAHLRDDWSAEILLGLRATLFKLTIWDHDASYGAALQNLRYRDARAESTIHAAPKIWQKVLYGLFSVGGRYAWTKWEDYLLDVEGGYEEPTRNMQLLSKVSNTLSLSHSVAAFFSFSVFLLDGKYRTLIDRILRLRLAPTSNQVSREVSFEYLNRQLVWHAFTEFLLFLLPLVGISRWRRWLARAWRKTSSILRKNSPQDEDDTTATGELGFLPERTCAICYQDQNPTSTTEQELVALTGASGVVGSSQTDITNPYETIPCGCIYCFICIAQRLEAEDGEGWVCLRCGEIIKECKPWDGDVVEEARRPSSQKSVTFAEGEKGSHSLKVSEPSPALVENVPAYDDDEDYEQVGASNTEETLDGETYTEEED